MRRIDGPAGVLLARDEVDDRGEPRIDGQKLADYAERLGHTADELADVDPLPAPARAIEALQAVTVPAGVARPAANRLPGLAAAVSSRAALSSRLEIYPRGMAAERALRLALGRACGGPHAHAGGDPGARRVALPGRGAAARAARSRRATATRRAANCAGIPGGGRRAGRLPLAAPPFRDGVPRRPATRAPPVARRGSPRRGSAAWGDTEAFDQRLRRALENRAFLALTVSPRRLAATPNAPWRRAFAIDPHSADELLIRHMKAAAREAGADWRIVLRADRGARAAAPTGATLMRLVGHRALPRVSAELAASPRPVLLTNLGLLARYDQMAFLDGLRDSAGRTDGPPGVWLLVTCDAQGVSSADRRQAGARLHGGAMGAHSRGLA